MNSGETFENNREPSKTNKKETNRKGIFRAINELKQLQEIIKDQPEVPENQFDCFGKSVASQLKQLNYENALIAQSRIQTILTELAIQNFRRPYSSMSSMTSSTDRSDPLSPDNDDNNDILAKAVGISLINDDDHQY